MSSREATKPDRKQRDVEAKPRRDKSAAKPRARKRWVRLALFVAVVAALVPAILYGVVWFQERPLNLAEAALYRGHPDQALKLVDGFLEEHPNSSRALSLRARSYVAVGRSADALALFGKIGAANAADVHALAQAYLMQEQWSLALPPLIRVLELEPNNVDALYEITACRVKLGLYDQALQSALQFAESPEGGARGQVFLASINSDLQNHEQAVEAFARAIELSPEARGLQVPPDEFFLEYGRTLMKLGRPADALPVLERSLAARPTAAAYVSLGSAKAQLGKRTEASAAWQRALEHDPANRPAREELANDALQQGNAQAALKWLTPFKGGTNLWASTAYLFQQSYVALRDVEQAKQWQAKAATLREKERHGAALDNLVFESPESSWGRAIRAHRFAAQGNWAQAQAMVAVLLAEGNRTSFVTELAEAIKRRGPLPDVEKIPVTRH